ncbi:MAG: homoserine O-acetyltransferase [Gammaproteobacteria bacterium]|nr:homoserine O-acetyltransferase [Gammaproteobacteria bacterium]MDD9869371.1 homoserine O-acetyltransferase [Gammaproteobacteria bacterium]MDD9886248.1 homoserine O-acetyltransferase [Gammaproteobacteria bacterium]
MPDSIPADSVGLVETRYRTFDGPLALDCGRELPGFTLAYETYGTLNDERSNALLICHALSSDQHAAGYHSMDDAKPGWWDSCIGPGKPFNTDEFFVVCPNNLGGCKGSTGPNTANPETGELYASDFPIVTVRDWVRSQKLLADALGITRWAAVIGGSLGGMQAMQWAIDYPDRLAHALLIAAAPKLSAQNIAFNEVARQAIVSDADFNGGRYYDQPAPKKGLMLARMLGHITYLSDDAMRDKFGRDLKEGKLNFNFDIEFQVESYLRHQGESFTNRFDANTYLLMTKALDYFDPAADFGGDLAAAFARTAARFLVVSFTTDWRFPPARSREITRALVQAGKQASYCTVKAHQGHDAFLMPVPQYLAVLDAYTSQILAGV